MFDSNSINCEENLSHQQSYVLENVKKKRDEYLVEIRCQQREKILNKKRFKDLPESAEPNEINLAPPELEQDFDENNELKNYISVCLKRNYDLSDFEELVESFNSENRFNQHFGVIGIRKILSVEGNPPLQRAIDAGIIPRLVKFMEKDDEQQLQLEAAWVLANIASGNAYQTRRVLDEGAMPLFVKLLKSPQMSIVEQGIWAIGNISGDSAESRDMALANGALHPMVAALKRALEQKDNIIVKQGTWALSNLCRGKPAPQYERVRDAVPVLSTVVQEAIHLDVLSDALWAITHLSEGNYLRVGRILQTGIVPSLVRHLDCPYISVVVPALRILGNIVAGNDEQTDMVLQVPNVIKKLFRLLRHDKKAVRREVCWALSNIAAGRSDQLELIIGNTEYVHQLMKVALSDTLEVKREAAWILTNSTNDANEEQVISMARSGVLDCMCKMLKQEEGELIEIGLTGIQNYLNFGALMANRDRTDNIYLLALEQNGAVSVIHDLQYHGNSKVYELALKILETHFDVEAETF